MGKQIKVGVFIVLMRLFKEAEGNHVEHLWDGSFLI